MFQEFAVTVCVAIVVSVIVSVTLTPMMCAYLLSPHQGAEAGIISRTLERGFVAIQTGYEAVLAAALRYKAATLSIMLASVAVTGLLFVGIPKGFFPQQDTGRLVGSIQADQSVSFQLMQQKLAQFVDIIKRDPAVETVVGFTGGGQTNSGFVFVSLRPLDQRKLGADGVIARLRRQMSAVPGATLFLQAVQDIRVGGRQSNAQYQYTLQGSTLEELNDWTPKIAAAMQRDPNLADVNSDQQNKGLESDLVIDRDAAARLGITVSQIDNTLYDAFGQRQVSTIYNPLNQYHVVMEIDPRYLETPQSLKQIFVSTSGGKARGSATTNAVAGTVAAGGTASRI